MTLMFWFEGCILNQNCWRSAPKKKTSWECYICLWMPTWDPWWRKAGTNEIKHFRRDVMNNGSFEPLLRATTLWMYLHETQRWTNALISSCLWIRSLHRSRYLDWVVLYSVITSTNLRESVECWRMKWRDSQLWRRRIKEQKRQKIPHFAPVWSQASLS